MSDGYELSLSAFCGETKLCREYLLPHIPKASLFQKIRVQTNDNARDQSFPSEKIRMAQIKRAIDSMIVGLAGLPDNMTMDALEHLSMRHQELMTIKKLEAISRDLLRRRQQKKELTELLKKVNTDDKTKRLD